MTEPRRTYARVVLWLAERAGTLSDALLDHWYRLTGEKR